MTGIVDLHRITMSLKSLLDSEIKYAVDTLLALSFQKQANLVLQKIPHLVSAFMNAFAKSLEAAFGVLHKSKKHASTIDTSYADLFEEEIQEIDDFQVDCEPTFQNPRIMHAERAVVMGTILTNFSFYTENGTFLATLQSFLLLLDRLLILVSLPRRSPLLQGLTPRQAGLLDHRKNLVTLISNMGAQFVIPTSSGQVLCDLLRDFLAYPESPYAYTALEALAKLSLLDQNREIFVTLGGLEEIIYLTSQRLPSQGLTLNATPETVAAWELASLLIYNLSDMGDDTVRAIITSTPGLLGALVRIASSGIRVGNDVHADYIRIITLRMLKTLMECTRSMDARHALLRHETVLLPLVFQIKRSQLLTREFQDEASELVLDILKGLREESDI